MKLHWSIIDRQFIRDGIIYRANYRDKFARIEKLRDPDRKSIITELEVSRSNHYRFHYSYTRTRSSSNTWDRIIRDIHSHRFREFSKFYSNTLPCSLLLSYLLLIKIIFFQGKISLGKIFVQQRYKFLHRDISILTNIEL